MSAWVGKSGGPPLWMWGLLGITAVGAVWVVADAISRHTSDKPRPSGGGSVPGTVTPGAPPAPDAIAPEAEAIAYAGHTIYLWEQLDESLDFVAWKWVTLDTTGLVFDSGSVATPGVAGAAQARKAAETKIDRKYA